MVVMKPVHALLLSSVFALPACIQARATTEKPVETVESETPQSRLFSSRPHMDYGPSIMVSLGLSPNSLELQTQGFVLATLPCEENSHLLSKLTSGDMAAVPASELPASIRHLTSERIYGLREDKVVCQGTLKPYAIEMNHAQCGGKEPGYIEIWGIMESCADKYPTHASMRIPTHLHNAKPLPPDLQETLKKIVLGYPETTIVQKAYVDRFLPEPQLNLMAFAKTPFQEAIKARVTTEGLFNRPIFVHTPAPESTDITTWLLQPHWVDNDVKGHLWSHPSESSQGEVKTVQYATLSVGSDSICNVPQRTFFFRLEPSNPPVLLHSDVAGLFGESGFIADFDQDGALEFANKDQEGALFWKIGQDSLTLISPQYRHEKRDFCANEAL